MGALLIIINILLILIAIVLIVCVLMQEGNRAGLGAIGGGAETFFGKSKAKGIEGKLQLITKVGAGVFIVLAIVATAMTARIGTETVDSVPPVAIEEGAESELGTEEPDLVVEPEAGAETDAVEPDAATEPEAVEPETVEPETAVEPEADDTAADAVEPTVEPTVEETPAA